MDEWMQMYRHKGKINIEINKQRNGEINAC